jgi:glycerol-3-phosphate dehydrogenase (NAD(P)+)
MRIAVLGGGAWGTTLADLLSRNGNEVRLWVREEELAAEMTRTRRNETYMPELELHEGLAVTADASWALAEAAWTLVAIPSQYLRGALAEMIDLFPGRPTVVCASKGIENGTLATMSEVVAEALGAKNPRFAMLSGPSFAAEVARRMPTAVSLACESEDCATELQLAFASDFFRVYTNPDVRGVELGGAVKNVMAIAAGISDGLGFGHNARAGLITRGLAEMSRLGAAMGADPRTFMGLSGMGDLVLTCTGDLSRNRQVGLRIGAGESLEGIIASMRAVAEGVRTTESVIGLGERHGVEAPISQQVHAMLFSGKDPGQAVRELMGRNLKSE